MRSEFWQYRRGDLTRGEVRSGFYYWTLSAVLGVLVVVGFALLAPSRRSDTTTIHALGPEPQLEQALAVAGSEFGQLSGGGWAGAWTVWSDSARRSVSEADFVQLNTECRPDLGVPYVIVESSMAGGQTARVTWRHGTESGSNYLVYEDGSWHFEPDPVMLAAFRSPGGVEGLVSARKAAGECH